MSRLKSAKVQSRAAALLLAIAAVAVAAPAVAQNHDAPGAFADVLAVRGRPVLQLSMSPPPDLVGKQGGIYVAVSDDTGMVRYVGSDGLTPGPWPVHSGVLPRVWQHEIDLQHALRMRGEIFDRSGNLRCAAITGGAGASMLTVEIGYSSRGGESVPTAQAASTAGRLDKSFSRLANQLEKMGRGEEAERVRERQSAYSRGFSDYQTANAAYGTTGPAGQGEPTMMQAASFTCGQG